MIVKSRKIKIAVICTLLSIALPHKISSEIIINEILSNEPGSATSLEWIELYNSFNFTEILNGYFLVSGTDTIYFSLSDSIQQDSYIIICRKLYGTNSFESYWGNNSQVWGDTLIETYYDEPIVALFSLINSNGTVKLSDSNSILISQFDWTAASGDGISWERVFPDSQLILESVDGRGSSPGKVNSRTQVSGDLTIDSIAVVLENGITKLVIEIGSLSPTTVFFRSFVLIDASFGDTLLSVILPEILPGDNYIYTVEFSFDSLYQQLEAKLGDDARVENNIYLFTAPGIDFPPLILNEILPNPTANLLTEWVEIINIYSAPIDIKDWGLKIGNNIKLITTLSFLISPGDYLLLVEDSISFVNYYGNLQTKIIQPNSWDNLKNSNDTIRLLDNYSLEADGFEYLFTLDSNYTWSRGESLENQSWGQSQYQGGSPGEKNQVTYKLNAPDIRISVSPEIFSPDNDGYEDFAQIKIDAPTADYYSVKIYDREGREVKTFYDRRAYIPSMINWDGKANSGKLLPVGIYIIYFEAGNSFSEKKTVVIAR